MNVVKITSSHVTLELTSECCREIYTRLRERAQMEVGPESMLANDILSAFFHACAYAIDLSLETQLRLPRILESFQAEQGFERRE